MGKSEQSEIEITTFAWVPAFARGYVRDLRLRWACKEIGLPYRVRLISATDRPDWYYKEQPWGQVPFMTDGDVSLFESGACLIHLGEKDERLLPQSGQARADALSWMVAAINSVEPFNFEMMRVKFFARKEEWAALREPSLIVAARERQKRLADAMKGREWLAGDFSIADIMMTTVLRESQRYGFLDGEPVLTDYLDRAMARPAFVDALEEQLSTIDANAPAK